MVDRTPAFGRDVEAARRYFAEHQEPEGGWTPAHLMYGAETPTLGEHGNGNDDPVYAREVWKAAISRG